MSRDTKSDKELAEEYRSLDDDNDPSQFERDRMRKMLLSRFHARNYAELEEKVDELLYGSPSTPADVERTHPIETAASDTATKNQAEESSLERFLARAKEMGDERTVTDLTSIRDNWRRRLRA